MKITTVVPAFKPKYLSELLTALYHQTVKPARIIISDDSPDGAFKTALLSEALRPAMQALNIEVIDGPRRGAFANCRHLLNIWNGSTPLVHFLLDDDVIYPNFYERHTAAHASGMFDCTVSKRWTALESGHPVGELPCPTAVAHHPHRILSLESNLVFATTIPQCNNWFGELSNAVFNHEVANFLDDPRMEGISFEGLGDIGFFLSASLNKPIGYLNEPLGYFRTNPAQNTQQIRSHDFKLAHLAWIALALAAKRMRKIQQQQAAQCFCIVAAMLQNRYTGVADMAQFSEMVPALTSGDLDAEERFIEKWHEFILAR
ncbi:glycosyltransferase family A protein [Paraburkholderia heleia]|uniref:glycosyltransferase family 2 protein n=1 Tax=Paraburkholderia heleia TaxID=634127 RepID=UPI0031D8D575